MPLFCRAVKTPSGDCHAAVLLALGSNLSKGEPERIVLVFAVWLLPAAAATLRVVGVDSRSRWRSPLVVQLGWRLRW
jgi:hypothetical protein